ncbi:hypothetical protein SEO_00269, partial [Enterococcus faecium EnGen0134]
MAQLFYRYGTMNSGKSIELLKVAHNYEEQGKRVIIMTSAIDTRSGFGKVESRIGVSKPAIAITGMATVFLTNFIRCRTSFRMLFRLSLTMSLLG